METHLYIGVFTTDHRRHRVEPNLIFNRCLNCEILEDFRKGISFIFYSILLWGRRKWYEVSWHGMRSARWHAMCGGEHHGSRWRRTTVDCGVRCAMHDELNPGLGCGLSQVKVPCWPTSGKVEQALLDQLGRKLVAERVKKLRWAAPRPQQ
jgi:hypothetical protein